MQRKINFKIFSIILLMVASMTLSCLAQSQFEGKVVMNVKAGDKDTDMNMFVKGNKTLIQVNNEQKANLIMDLKAKTMTILMPEQKMYMEIDMNTMKGISDKIKKNDESESNEKTNGKFDKTGETKKINGYECEKWVYTDDNGDKTEAWMTKELGNFMGFSNHYVDGKVESSMEVKSVEKKSLDESMFEVPAGFNKLSMPMMNRGQH